MSEVEKTPKTGSDMAVLLDFLKKGGSRQEAANLPGFSRVKVAYTICNLRREGYYYQDPQERIREWREAVSRGRGGIWPLIKEYAQMQMSPAEIRGAVSLVHNQELSSSQVNMALPKARKRGYLLDRSPEERLDILKDSHRPQEEIACRVRTWLEVRQILETKGLANIPQGRSDWIPLSRFFYQRQSRIRGIDSPTNLFNDVFNVSPTQIPHLRDCVGVLSLATAQAYFDKKGRALFEGGWRINGHGEWSMSADSFLRDSD